MSKPRSKSQGLRQRAHKYHRKAKALLAARKIWEASLARDKALQLEHEARECEVYETADNDAAGFHDSDLPDYATAQPRANLWG